MLYFQRIFGIYNKYMMFENSNLSSKIIYNLGLYSKMSKEKEYIKMLLLISKFIMFSNLEHENLKVNPMFFAGLCRIFKVNNI